MVSFLPHKGEDFSRPAIRSRGYIWHLGDGVPFHIYPFSIWIFRKRMYQFKHVVPGGLQRRAPWRPDLLRVVLEEIHHQLPHSLQFPVWSCDGRKWFDIPSKYQLYSSHSGWIQSNSNMDSVSDKISSTITLLQCLIQETLFNPIYKALWSSYRPL